MNNEDGLSKNRGINLIFSKTKESDIIVFSPLRFKNVLNIKGKII